MKYYMQLLISTYLLWIGIILLVFVDYNTAVLNIYLNKPEVSKLLGVQSELYYVRNGIINQNALNFPIAIPLNMNQLQFTWQSLDSKPIPYVISLVMSDSNLLNYVTLNISDAADIPMKEESFVVKLPSCEVAHSNYTLYMDIAITLNQYMDNITQINFKRRRQCHFDVQNKESFTGDDIPTTAVIYSVSSLNSKLVYIGLCIGCSLVTMLIIFFLAYFISNKDLIRHNILHPNERISIVQNSEPEHIPHLIPVGPILPLPNTGTSTSSNMSHSSSHRWKNYTALDGNSMDLHDRIAEITIQRKRVRLQKVELEGTFGRVFYGTYMKEDGTEEDVIVKTVMDFSSSTQISLLLKEGLAMYGLKHKNIMTVLGVSIEDHTEPFVIYSRQGFSNLKKFLQKCKVCPEGIAHTLTTQEVVKLALQIISGVQYMHKKKLLHKDLATRNCVIDCNLNVKVTDNALSRDLFPNDYHCLGDNENRSVKWLAIESLTQRIFSTSSDVWSFGVTLWELTTLAQQPYAEVDPFEIEHYLKDGYRLSQPVNCPDELFAVMAYCWAMSPDERPTFSQLYTCLEDFYAQLNKYV